MSIHSRWRQRQEERYAAMEAAARQRRMDDSASQRAEVSEERQGVWGRRVVASILDGVVVALPLVVLHLALGQPILGHDSRPSPGVTLAIGVVIAAVYFVPVMLATNGQTLGKRLLDVRVQRRDGSALTPLLVAWREPVLKTGVVGGAPLLLAHTALAGLSLMLIFGDGGLALFGSGRAAHDYAAGTLVGRAAY